jgi:two-component system nitrogen regulation sensor histidine kinase NtrY
MGRLFAAEFPAIPLDLVLPETEFAIDADADLLAQAIINLLRNAAEAANAEAPQVELRLAKLASGETSVAVSDNGGGVPAEIARDIFLPFFTTRANRTGVGLNLVRQIVFAHGGTIEAKRADLGGARFEMVF